MNVTKVNVARLSTGETPRIGPRRGGPTGEMRTWKGVTSSHQGKRRNDIDAIKQLAS